MKKKAGNKQPAQDPHPSNEWFRKFATHASLIVGNPWSFVMAVTMIAAWAVLGPVFDFADTWQLIINTTTTIITFLMVFLIQNTQNRDARAIHLKLDELIHAVKGARDQMIDLEDLSEEQMAKLQEEFKATRKKALSKKCDEIEVGKIGRAGKNS